MSFPGNICLLSVNNRDTRKGCEICSKLKIKKARQNNVNEVALMFLSLTLNIFHFFFFFFLGKLVL